MNTKIPNIEVIRSLWRRVKKGIKVRDPSRVSLREIASAIGEKITIVSYNPAKQRSGERDFENGAIVRKGLAF
jgi:hypothetical protein